MSFFIKTTLIIFIICFCNVNTIIDEGYYMKTYTNLLIFIILCFLIFDFFQMYSFKKNLKENIEIISSQIADLDEDIHILEDLIEKKKD